MTDQIRVFIVEDSVEEVATWQRQLEFFNAKQNESGAFTINPTFARSFAEAERTIADIDFDAAVVDLGLGPATIEGLNADGNKLVDILLRRELAVVAIFTGQPTDAAPPEYAKDYIKVFSKGGDEQDGTQQVMEWIVQHAPMMLAIRAAKEAIQDEMATLFAKSIWPRWRFWLNGKEKADQDVIAAVSRHLAAHVYASLLERAGQKVVAEEWYFVPPLRDEIRTGDLVEVPGLDEGPHQYELVITPRCDLAGHEGNKNETIQLALCVDVAAQWKEKAAAVEACIAKQPNANASEKDRKKWESGLKEAKASARRLVQHENNSGARHFIHSFRVDDNTEIGPFLVHFDKIRSVIRSSPEGGELIKMKRVATVAPEFLPSVVERLGTFFSRFGTPDYSFPEE